MRWVVLAVSLDIATIAILLWWESVTRGDDQ
jgi:hypothetical protein